MSFLISESQLGSNCFQIKTKTVEDVKQKSEQMDTEASS